MGNKYLDFSGLKLLFYTKVLKLINLKIDKTNGDISDTKVRSVDTITTEFPDPIAGENTKTFLGKVKKCLADWKAIKSTLLTLSMLTSQHENSTSKIPTAALAYAINQDIIALNSKLYTELSSGVDGRTIFPSESGQAMYRCTTSNHAPKISDEAYIIVVYRDWDFIIQVWYSLWYDVVYYNRCDISNNWTWSGFKKQDMTPI